MCHVCVVTDSFCVTLCVNVYSQSIRIFVAFHDDNAIVI